MVGCLWGVHRQRAGGAAVPARCGGARAAIPAAPSLPTVVDVVVPLPLPSLLVVVVVVVLPPLPLSPLLRWWWWWCCPRCC